MMDKIKIGNSCYEIIRLLGKGKGGYTYLSRMDNKLYALKKIHHEPCDYYSFGDKFESEMQDYNTLRGIGITMPEMLESDKDREIIIKEYIEGDTVFDMIMKDMDISICLEEIRKMCEVLYANNLNIDYFPTNFICRENRLYYVDYECNAYMEEWDFENWGIKYWYKSSEFMDYVKEKENESYHD